MADQSSTSELEKKLLLILRERLTTQLVTSLQVCAHCGLCAESCPYFLALDKDPRMSPVYKADRLRKWHKRRVDWLGRVLPGWVGARDLDEKLLEEWFDLAFGACTLCARCTYNCPFGVDIPLILRTARGILVELGRVPKGLQDTVDVHLQTRNNMGVSDEDFRETVDWLNEELQAELGTDDVLIPLDKQGARAMYLVNPREVKFYPLTLMAAAKIMYAAGADWTLSTAYWDVTNYALFSGDDEAARTIAGWAEEAAKALGVEEVWMSECGHGFNALRWGGENWLGHRFPFRVRGFVEVMAEFLQEGRITLDPTRNTKRVTYHDPCNQCRKGGIVDEPRYILARTVMDFVEMEPHGKENYCCGGGGGMLSMTEFSSRRLQVGRVKAEQIRATGAQIVATSCHNCLDQLAELSRHYKLGVEVKNLCELVADALVFEPKPSEEEQPSPEGAATPEAEKAR
ncbi:MAG: (Fe-S)-binding protein [Anaerolineae bacterium]